MRRVIDRAGLPPQFPTHRLDASFWEALGRAIGSFGFLEEILAKAIFVVTGNRPAGEDTAASLEAWQKRLEKAATNTLRPLADDLEKAVIEYDASLSDEVIKLTLAIKNAANIRDALCHSSWSHAVTGNSVKPFYVDRKQGVFESVVDIQFLTQAHEEAAHLVCDVMDLVEALGLSLAGSDKSKLE